MIPVSSLILPEYKQQMNNFKEKADLIWRVADLLRGDYKQSDYGKLILPMTVIRRDILELEERTFGKAHKALEI